MTTDMAVGNTRSELSSLIVRQPAAISAAGDGAVRAITMQHAAPGMYMYKH